MPRVVYSFHYNIGFFGLDSFLSTLQRAFRW
jgi:hypothetical protein